MLYLMALVIAAPVIILAVLPCKWRWYIKLAAGTAVLLIALKMMILRLIGGPLFFCAGPAGVAADRQQFSILYRSAFSHSAAAAQYRQNCYQNTAPLPAVRPPG